MTPEDIEAEIEYAKTRFDDLKDQELKALLRWDKADEAACSRLRDEFNKRIDWLKSK
jgi:hypothetical protein